MLKEILQDKTYIVQQYLNDCIKLIKSFIILSTDEAGLYNDQLKARNPYIVIEDDKRTWRYYRHVAGLKHSIDEDIKLISIDTGALISLTRENINKHTTTKEYLLRFDYYYDELVSKYPEQVLYILACILPSDYTIDKIIKLPTFTIVAYDKNLIEENEYNLKHELTQFIENYQVIWLIPYYGLSDGLFLASQYAIFHLALVNKLIAIRLKNAKTQQAHSFHIKNYLASHHYLDNYYRHMTPKQRYWLYKNILFLDNHVGREEIFKLLLSKLFEDRKISVFNYTKTQSNELDINNDVTYKFHRKYLTTAYSIQEINVFNLADIERIEGGNAPSNQDIWNSDRTKIDNTLKMSPYNSLLTKDIESVIYDYTDNVNYKLMDVIVNYWGYLIKTDRVIFNLPVKNSANNSSLILSNEDAYKLFIVALYKLNNISLVNMPVVKIPNVYREDMPTARNIVKSFFGYRLYYEKEVDRLLETIPAYTTISSIDQFYEIMTKFYYSEIELWIYKCNLSSKENYGQITKAISLMHEDVELDLDNGEVVSEFLDRVGFGNLSNFSSSELEGLTTSIIDTAFAGKYLNLFDIKNVQKAMVSIFQTLSSYNIQFTNSHTIIAPILANMITTRVNVNDAYVNDFSIIPYYISYIDIKVLSVMVSLEHYIRLDIDVRVQEEGIVNINFSTRVMTSFVHDNDLFVSIPLMVVVENIPVELVGNVELLKLGSRVEVTDYEYMPEVVNEELLQFLLDNQ